jgi:hypothetical protein
MGDKHEKLVSKYRQKLINKGYSIIKKSPFVDYRPDIFASKNKEKIFVEVEVEKSIHNDHTLNQLENMHGYVRKSRQYKGLLVVPKKAMREASLLVESVFGDNRIKIVGL